MTKQVFEDKPSDGKSFTWKLQPQHYVYNQKTLTQNQEKTGNENETDIGLIFHESCLWNEGSLELTFIMKRPESHSFNQVF